SSPSRSAAPPGPETRPRLRSRAATMASRWCFGARGRSARYGSRSCPSCSPPHLPHAAAAMDLDRHLPCSQLRGALLVELPRHDEGHDLALTRRERGVAILQRRQLVLPLPGDLVALERLVDGIEQVLVVERLGEELDRAGLHGLHGRRDVAVAGDED